MNDTASWKQKRCLKLTEGVNAIRPTYSPIVATRRSRAFLRDVSSRGSTAARSSASASSASVVRVHWAKSFRNSDVVKWRRNSAKCRWK